MCQLHQQDSYPPGLKVFHECQQICQSGNLLAEMGVMLLADLVTVSKSASQYICWQNWQGVNLPADLVTVTKSANQ